LRATLVSFLSNIIFSSIIIFIIFGEWVPFKFAPGHVKIKLSCEILKSIVAIILTKVILPMASLLF